VGQRWIGLLLLAFVGCDGGHGMAPDSGPGATDAGTPRVHEWHAPAREMMQPFVDEGYVPGFSIVVWRDGEAQFLGLGRVDPAAEGTPTPDTIYEVASITKTFTGTLLALAVQRGDVTLDTTLQSLVPSSWTVPTRGSEPIRLWHLASHRSGLPTNIAASVTPAVLFGAAFAPVDETTAYTAFLLHLLEFEPGTSYLYSNYAVGLLGWELQRLTGSESFDALLAGVTDPLGMGDTRVQLSSEQMQRLAPPRYAPDQRTPAEEMGVLAGFGGVRSSGRDLGRWMGAQIIEPEGELGDAVRLSHEPRGTAPDGASYGLGWRLLPYDGQSIVTHAGSLYGATSIIYIDREARIGVALLTNSRVPNELKQLGLAFFDELRGRSWRDGPFIRPWPEPHPRLDLPSTAYDELVGRYAWDGNELELLVDDGRLYAQFGASRFTRLHPVAEDEWRPRYPTARMLVARDGVGVAGVRWIQEGDHLYVRAP